jgi:hypothetical protein
MKRLILALTLVASAAAMAQSEPFQASLTPALAIHDSTTLIEGLTLSVWGENPQRALSIGIANGSVGDSTGFSLGFLLNYSDSYTGVMWGAVNYSTGEFLGWQGAFVNYSEGPTKGLQTGWVNYAQRMKGLQFGLLNFAESVDEVLVQIGFLNIIRTNDIWFSNLPDEMAPAMVIVNWKF